MSSVRVIDHDGIGPLLRGRGHRYIVHVQIGEATVQLEFEPGYENVEATQIVDLTPDAPHPEPRW